MAQPGVESPGHKLNWAKHTSGDTDVCNIWNRDKSGYSCRIGKSPPPGTGTDGTSVISLKSSKPFPFVSVKTTEKSPIGWSVFTAVALSVAPAALVAVAQAIAPAMKKVS